MLSRRNFILATTSALPMLACSPADDNGDVRSPPPSPAQNRPETRQTAGDFSIEQLQQTTDLGVSVGSLMGAGLAIPTYLGFVAAAPAALVNVFGAYARNSNAQSALVRSAREYVDFRYEDTSRQISQLRMTLQEDAARDRLAYQSMTAAIVGVSRRLEALSSSESVSLTEFRQFKESLNNQLESLREEGSRSELVSPVYPEAEGTTRSIVGDDIEALRREMAQCTQESLNLKEHIRILTEQVVQG